MQTRQREGKRDNESDMETNFATSAKIIMESKKKINEMMSFIGSHQHLNGIL